MPQLLPVLRHLSGAAARPGTAADTSREQQCPNISQHPASVAAASAPSSTPQIDVSPASEFLQDMSPMSPGFSFIPAAAASPYTITTRMATSSCKSQLRQRFSTLEGAAVGSQAATHAHAAHVNGVGNHHGPSLADGGASHSVPLSTSAAVGSGAAGSAWTDNTVSVPQAPAVSAPADAAASKQADPVLSLIHI